MGIFRHTKMEILGEIFLTKTNDCRISFFDHSRHIWPFKTRVLSFVLFRHRSHSKCICRKQARQMTPHPNATRPRPAPLSQPPESNALTPSTSPEPPLKGEVLASGDVTANGKARSSKRGMEPRGNYPSLRGMRKLKTSLNTSLHSDVIMPEKAFNATSLDNRKTSDDVSKENTSLVVANGLHHDNVTSQAVD